MASCREESRLARKAKRRERVRGLTRLRDRDEKRIRGHDRVAVAELARDLDAAGHPAELLDEIARDDASVVARAAGDDVHRRRALEDFRGRRPESLRQQPPARDAFLQRLRDGARLLVDLLQHEVGILAALRGRRALLRNVGLALDLVAARVDDFDALAADAGDVALFKDHELPRDGQERRDIRCDEVLLLADADERGTSRARKHDAVRVLAPHHRQRVRAAKLANRLLHRLEEVPGACEVVMDAVCDHLGVGIGGELVAEPFELRAKLLVILDDAVVHDRDAVARDVRVGVALVRHAVGRPARMCDSEVAGRGVGGERLGELRDLADCPQARDLCPAVQHGDPGRVIAAVFEALQALDQDRDDVPVSDRSDDAAHGPDILFHRPGAGARPTENCVQIPVSARRLLFRPLPVFDRLLAAPLDGELCGRRRLRDRRARADRRPFAD